MDKEKILEDFAKIDGWFNVSHLIDKEITEHDKLLIIDIIHRDYVEYGQIISKIIDNEHHFIHSLVLKKNLRARKINELIDEDFDILNLSLPLPKGVDLLTMIDARKLNLSQLKMKLGYEDERKVKAWLKQKGIPLQKEGREKVVFEFNIELALQVELIESLKIQYPIHWEQIYKTMSSSQKMTQSVLEIAGNKRQTEKRKNYNKPKKYI